MRYSVETTKDGYTERLEIGHKEYVKKWTGISAGASSKDTTFKKQLEQDGISDKGFIDGVFTGIDISGIAYELWDMSVCADVADATVNTPNIADVKKEILAEAEKAQNNAVTDTTRPSSHWDMYHKGLVKALEIMGC